MGGFEFNAAIVPQGVVNGDNGLEIDGHGMLSFMKGRIMEQGWRWLNLLSDTLLARGGLRSVGNSGHIGVA
ncbi:MAG TPA: hypothetical protein DCF62_07950 [Porticoccaceae bacterium]|nr:hypothetical protein [Porticoccaceae bacterium]